MIKRLREAHEFSASYFFFLSNMHLTSVTINMSKSLSLPLNSGFIEHVCMYREADKEMIN